MTKLEEDKIAAYSLAASSTPRRRTGAAPVTGDDFDRSPAADALPDGERCSGRGGRHGGPRGPCVPCAEVRCTLPCCCLAGRIDFADGGKSLLRLAALWLMVPRPLAVGALRPCAALARARRSTASPADGYNQFGVALPITFNVPFRSSRRPVLQTYTDGTGDIPLALTGKERVAYFCYGRMPGRGASAGTEPMLRAGRTRGGSPSFLARALVAAAEFRPPVAAASRRLGRAGPPSRRGSGLRRRSEP